MTNLLDELRAAIKASGLSGYRLAKDSGVTAGQVSRLMRGERGLSVESAEKLAAALGLRVELVAARKVRKGR